MNNNKFERLLAKNSYSLTRGHDFVEIGGVKWATCNVGAEKPTDPGLYFAFGETKGYTANEIEQGIRYFNIENHEISIINNSFQDVVKANWGGKWRMPTIEEFFFLERSTRPKWTDNYQGSGMAGMILTDLIDSDKVLFFPAVGWAVSNHLFNMNACGHYLAMSRPQTLYEYVRNMYFYCYGRCIYLGCHMQYSGCQVRGVFDC